LNSREINEIVKFTLTKYNIEAKWRIIPLTWDQWKKLSMEKTSSDVLAWKLGDKIKELLEKEETKKLLENDNELRRKINDASGMEKEIEKEYGRVLTLEDNLNSVSIIFLKSKSFKRLREKFPFQYKLSKRNSDRDFLILLNSHLFHSLSTNEKLKTVVHETLHFIQGMRETRSRFDTIENEANTIVCNFLLKLGNM